MSFSTWVANKGLNSAFEPQIQYAALTYNVPASLIKGVISVESGWDPNARNPRDGSRGLMQIHPASWGNVSNDPAWSITMGASILAEQLRKRGGDAALALAAYNTGTSLSDDAVRSRIASNVLIQAYVADVMTYAAWFDGMAGGDSMPLDGGAGFFEPGDGSGSASWFEWGDGAGSENDIMELPVFDLEPVLVEAAPWLAGGAIVLVVAALLASRRQ